MEHEACFRFTGRAWAAVRIGGVSAKGTRRLTAETAPDASHKSPRIDQRVLMAGTTLRFLLLLAIMPVACVWMLRQFLSPGTFLHGPGDEAAACLLNVSIDASGDRPDRHLMALMNGRPNPLAHCASSVGSDAYGLATAGTVLVLLAAFAVYWMMPAWKARRGHLLPVERVDADGQLTKWLADLTAQAGLSRAPRFVLDPRALTASAVVFGRRGSYTVCLHAGLVARRLEQPEEFEAVVLHELAHLRNRDVDITYATVALWRVFLPAVIVPYGLQQALFLIEIHLPGMHSELTLRPGPAVVRNLAVSVFLVSLVYLTRADVLRSRELYADLDAIEWGAARATWRMATTSGPQSKFALLIRSFAELWRTHPRWDERSRTLEAPSALFGCGALQMFLLGAAAMVLADLLPLGILGLHGHSADIAGGWLTAALVSAISGIALARGAVYALATCERPPSGVRAGVWLGLGMVVGELMLFRTGVYGWGARYPVMLLVLVLGAVVTTAWSAQWTLLLLGLWRGSTARTAMWGTLPVIWCTLASWFVWWNASGYSLAANVTRFPLLWWRSYLLQQVPGGPVDDQAGLARALATVYPLVDELRTNTMLMTVAVAMWVLPLAAWAWRPVAGPPGWLRSALRRPTADASNGRAGTLALRTIGGAAAVGGAVSWAMLLAAMVYVHASRPVEAQRGGAYALSYVFLWALAALAGTVAAAMVGAARTRTYRMAAGLAAAGCAALPALAGQFVLSSLDGCLGPAAVLGDSCRWNSDEAQLLVQLWSPLVLGAGLFVAGGAALLTVVMGGKAGRGEAARDGVGMASRPRSLPKQQRRAAVAAISAATVGIAAWTGHADGAAGPWSGLLQQSIASQVLGSGMQRTVDRLNLFALELWASGEAGHVLARVSSDVTAYQQSRSPMLDQSMSQADLTAAERVRTACRNLAKDAAGGSRMHKPSEPERMLWLSMLDEAREGSAICLDAFIRGDAGRISDADAHLATAALAQQQILTLVKKAENTLAPHSKPSGKSTAPPGQPEHSTKPLKPPGTLPVPR